MNETLEFHSQIHALLIENSITPTSIEPFSNPYAGSAAKPLFKITAEDGRQYLAKAISGDAIGREFQGYCLFHELLPTPNLLARDDGANSGTELLIYEFYPSETMCDAVHHNDGNDQDSPIDQQIETAKNQRLREIYLTSLCTTTYAEWLDSPLNDLFAKKLFGEVFEQYYGKQCPIASFMEAKLMLNGRHYPRTGYEILNDIKAKLQRYESNQEAPSILGHGDLHHMNVLVGEDGDWKVIDFEYHSTVPVAMEVAKPYYIDFIGTLFFFFQQTLADKFDFNSSNHTVDREGTLHLDIRQRGTFTNRIDLTKSKVRYLGDLIKQYPDYLTFNEYLILCHALSHNPNTYTPEAQLLFIATLQILSDFDWENPDSFFDPFKIV